MPYWCVVRTFTGKEDLECGRIARVLGKDLVKDTFIMRYERMRKYNKTWHKEIKSLYPGYIFILTDNPDELAAVIWKVPGPHKLLKSDMDVLYLSPEEQAFLETVSNGEKVVEMSKGIIEGDTVKVVGGPMRGLEGRITHIDRHKRIATIDVTMFGRKIPTTLGLEVIMKRDGE